MIYVSPELDAEHRAVYHALSQFIQKLPPDLIAQYLAGIVGSIVTDLPDETWRGMLLKAAIPCGKQNCNCHTLNSHFLDACDDLREVLLAQIIDFNIPRADQLPEPPIKITDQ